MGKTKGNKLRKASAAKLKPKQRLKLVLGAKAYKALKKKCCAPKHPHCRNCPLLKAVGSQHSA